MKVFSVAGYTKSGKTTTIEHIIRELKRRGYSVGSVKDIHYDQFAMDTEGTNTHRHKVAGSELVTARGLNETDVLFQKQLDLHEIAAFYDTDYLVVEGVRDADLPIILTADCMADLDERYDGRVFGVSGKISAEIEAYKGLPAINALTDVKALVDLIEEKTFPLLPSFEPKCTKGMDYDARDACISILKGETTYQAVVKPLEQLALTVNGKQVYMVPFVQKILKNALLGVVSELDGYEDGVPIEIKIDGWKDV